MDENQTTQTAQVETKFCKECGQKIAKKAVICPHCGCQVESIANENAAPAQIVINNTNQNSNQNNMGGVAANAKNKWVALLLLLFLGGWGAHKFYEGRVGMGIIYIFTAGIFGFGLFIDFFALLFKPTTYYVN